MMKDKISEHQQNKKPINILLVEDSEDDIIITLRAFKKAQLPSHIYVVNDGTEALDFLNNQGQYQEKDKHPTPDLILLDINMPLMGGIECLTNIKNNKKFNYIPVTMLTSSSYGKDVIQSYEEGAASFIQKPVGFKDFIRIVEVFNSYWQKATKLTIKKDD